MLRLKPILNDLIEVSFSIAPKIDNHTPKLILAALDRKEAVIDSLLVINAKGKYSCKKAVNAI